jgi:DNA-binding CsgD family transcriptional regulator
MLSNGRYGTRIPTPRESRIIQLVSQGCTNREIAEAIGTTEHVVKNYLRIIYDKLGLWNRVELALWHEARTYVAATALRKSTVAPGEQPETGRDQVTKFTPLD